MASEFCHFCIVVAVLFLFGFAFMKLINYLFCGTKTKNCDVLGLHGNKVHIGWLRIVWKWTSFPYYLCSTAF